MSVQVGIGAAGAGPMAGALLTDRLELANLLRAEVRKGLTVEAASAFGSLAQDLTDETGLEQWAELDLCGLFARAEHLADPVAAPAATGRLGRLRTLLSQNTNAWERWAEAVLGVAVFAPLLVTWTGLAFAAHAYGELSRSAPQQATRPFLQLWESGFDGRLASWAQFGDIALTAVMFITALLLLAGFHAWIRHRAVSAERLAQDDRESRLSGLILLLARTQLLVSRYRLATPHQFAGELGAAVDRIAELTKNAVRAQAGVRQSLDLVDRLTADLGATATSMAVTVTALGSSSNQLEQVMQRGLDAFQAGQTAAVRAMDAARDEAQRSAAQNADALRTVASQVDQAGGQVGTALRDLTAVQDSLRQRSDAVVTAAAQGAQALQGVAAKTSQTISELRASVDRWDAAAAHWENAAARVAASTRSLPAGGYADSGQFDTEAVPAPPRWSPGYASGDQAGSADGQRLPGESDRSDEGTASAGAVASAEFDWESPTDAAPESIPPREPRAGGDSDDPPGPVLEQGWVA